jgi:hypothetical protein
MGHDMLADGQNVQMLCAGSRIADRNSTGVAYVVAHDLDKARRAFPATPAYVLDSAVQNRRILGMVVVVKRVSGTVEDGAVPVDD